MCVCVSFNLLYFQVYVTKTVRTMYQDHIVRGGRFFSSETAKWMK